MLQPQATATDRVTFAGIDEAGLGPILGPLCFGYSVFTAPRPRANLWKTLEGCVSGTLVREEARFVVADSKLVFARTPCGARRLELTALGFLSLLCPKRKPLPNGHALVWESPRELAVDAATIAEHPWYAPLQRALPRHHDRGRLELSVERLSRAARRAEVELIDAGVRVIPERALNASFRRTDNKAESVWRELAPILRRMFDLHARTGLRLAVDRQGGRSHYGGLLAALFPEASVKCLRERSELSAYHVEERDGPRRMRVIFAERGEQHSFAIALGSCLAKYARETCMDAFNESFSRHDADLSPTAGYNLDGRRWLDDAQRALVAAGVERRDLARAR